ncbi:YecA family protein [Bacillus infantis]|uniref:YecA family protein n=1 Tax=Bacillus infantis TaxID=324767 RepID=UPI00209CF393|nr:SEC-C metal-binding domain-containing protein [Bacillus infantis]MCP1158228.1 SEC-C metal-binding domain-containing protein [Bacillus infantis]
MSGNAVLEKQKNNILDGLKDLKKSQDIKQFKKHWSELSVPFTLNKGLSSFTKGELDQIRRNLSIKNASSLKKAELIILLQEKIAENLESIPLNWDSERFQLLLDIAESGGLMPAPHIEAQQIEYFRGTGIIYSGIIEGEPVLAVPNELIDKVKELKNSIHIRSAVNKNTEWIRLTGGLLYYYGTLSIVQLAEFLEKYLKHPVHLREYLNVIRDANSFRTELQINGDGYSNRRVFDAKRVIQEHQARKSLSYYPFTKQQLLAAGEPGFVERNKSYMQLVQFLSQHFEISKEDADQVAEECIFATRVGDTPEDLMKYLTSMFKFDSVEKLQALMDIVVELMNSTREWFLKGYTSLELSSMEKKQLKPLPAADKDTNADAKVGRNDPCPCGSGKKYKKCCGRSI